MLAVTLPSEPEHREVAMAVGPRIFAHRVNSDGNFDSVCPDCLLTISSERLEVDLRLEENNHYCDPALLNLLWGRKRYFE
jgi:hypothetical protein